MIPPEINSPLFVAATKYRAIGGNAVCVIHQHPAAPTALWVELPMLPRGDAMREVRELLISLVDYSAAFTRAHNGRSCGLLAAAGMWHIGDGLFCFNLIEARQCLNGQ